MEAREHEGLWGGALMQIIGGLLGPGHLFMLNVKYCSLL